MVCCLDKRSLWTKVTFWRRGQDVARCLEEKLLYFPSLFYQCVFRGTRSSVFGCSGTRAVSDSVIVRA